MCRSSAAVLALGVGLVALRASSASAYTINTTELGKRIRWATDSVTLQLDPALESFLPEGDARAAVEMGLDAWRGLARVPALVLRDDAPSHAPGHHGKRASNGVYLLEQWPYAPAKLAITVITYEMETGRLLDADVLVNGETHFALLDEREKTQGAQAAHYDLAAVLTHETGHLLGLGESDADPDATMWPYAVPGETQKRTLADDDEQGAITSYLGAPPAAANGCGAMSVASRRGSGPVLLLFSLALAALGLASRRTRARTRLAIVPVCVLGLVVGWGEPLETADGARERSEHVRAQGGPPRAARDEDPQLRLLAVEELAARGTRDDATLMEQLTADEDPRIASRAQSTLRALLARAPRTAVPASAPEATARLSHLWGRGHELVAGRARRGATVEREGLLFTEYDVRGADGRQLTLRVAGGSLGGIGQRALHGELPPADDQDVVVVPQPSGATRWAYQQDGKLFGGDLGDGPAIMGLL